jgi:serine phosphatase RsbU (regulator of sigma subunit)
MFLEDEVVPTPPGIAPAPPREALTPRVQEALDAALAYEGDDEEEDDDGPKTVDDKVAELLKSYRSIQRMAAKRFEENRKLKDEIDITRDMMKLYRKAAVRYAVVNASKASSVASPSHVLI